MNDAAGDSTVHVVEDDSDLRRSMRWMLQKAGLDVECHDSAEAFLEKFEPENSACVVLDMRMSGMSGLELQQRLIDQDWHTPIVFVTGHADVPMAVQAMEAGAAAFIEKPFERAHLLSHVQNAIRQHHRHRRQLLQRQRSESRLRTLTPREREIMEMAVAGKTTKEIAFHLDLSVRTIEKHRERIMMKTQSKSITHLVALAIQCGMRKDILTA